ncbi:hypothetical protein SGPA1_40979 [Streptomyces misionensis JCM 4497]
MVERRRHHRRAARPCDQHREQRPARAERRQLRRVRLRGRQRRRQPRPDGVHPQRNGLPDDLLSTEPWVGAAPPRARLPVAGSSGLRP